MKKLLSIILILGLLCGSAGAMANPWTESTAEEILQTLGLSLREPEGAENIACLMLEAEQLAEMQFVWQGAECVARIQPAAEFTDISGMCYEWDSEEACEIGWCEGKIFQADSDEGDVSLILWFDAAPGLMYSLSAVGETLSQKDMAALAHEVYLPVQGDV